MNRNDKKNTLFPKVTIYVSTTEVKATSAPLLALFTAQYQIFFFSHMSKWYFPSLPFPFSFDFCFPCWSYGSQPCLTQWNYEPCCVGTPKMDESWWRVLTKCGPLEKRMANHFSILTMRTPWMVWKGKKIWHLKMNSPGR